MKIPTNISKRGYVRLMFTLTYRHPMYIVFIVFGAILMTFGILSFAGINMYSDSPALQVAMGSFFLLILPVRIYTTSVRQYKSNKRISETIEYEFYDNRMKTAGTSFSGEKELNQVYKIL